MERVIASAVDHSPAGHSFKDQWITADGGSIFVRKWTPPDLRQTLDATILLFHDSLGCVELWKDFPSQLATATGLPVVAYDRPGFGRSDARFGPLPSTFIEDEATAVVPRLCDSLGLGAIIPFGHSVGGGMAIATAARLRQRCRAVITESAQSLIEDQTLAGVRAAKADFEDPELLTRLSRYHGDKTRWVLNAWIDTWLSPDFADWSLDRYLADVHCPVLVMHGDRDEYGSLSHPERIARLVPGPSQVVILQNCGHIPHREQQTRVLDEAARFLGSVRG